MIKYAVDEEVEVGSLWMSQYRRSKVPLDSIGTSIFRVEEIRNLEIYTKRIGLLYQDFTPFSDDEFRNTFIKIPPEYYLKLSRLKVLLHQCMEDQVSKESIYNVVFEAEL
jgi:hypothetical protein